MRSIIKNQFKNTSPYLKGFILCFLFLFFFANCLAGLVNYYGMSEIEKLVYYKREAVRSGLLKPIDGKTNILVFGSSRMAAGVNANFFDELFKGKTNTLNLGFPSHDISRSDAIFKDYLKNNDAPDAIILHVRHDGMNNNHPLNGNFFELLSYTLRDFPNNDIFFKKIFPAINMEWANKFLLLTGINSQDPLFEKIFKSVKTFQLNKKEYELKVKNLKEEILINKGQVWWVDKRRQLDQDYVDPHTDDIESEYSYIVTPKKYQEDIDDFIGLLDDMNIKVLLVMFPVRNTFRKQFNKQPELLTDLTKKYRNILISKDGWKLKFYSPVHFFDRGHMNLDGSRHFTKDIYKEFKEVYGAYFNL